MATLTAASKTEMRINPTKKDIRHQATILPQRTMTEIKTNIPRRQRIRVKEGVHSNRNVAVATSAAVLNGNVKHLG
ncbi:hypothetical protein BIW11_03695 [Tropilaelaps mercedesae]|uniref:Uncharacterized protein n=1 Tax=Tropilaelaps mercedesae TaxID=418985 RepID=A0A1V9XH77_9ACAR|nr:hypothetical protein BIW11_03695 [Tropilaelaps mercedesae]